MAPAVYKGVFQQSQEPRFRQPVCPKKVRTGLHMRKKLAVIKSYLAKPGSVQPKWFVVDATDKVVGRLASDIATILMGKHRPTYTPHVDTGDYVIVTNAEKVVFTGKKWEQKEYTWYTGFPGLRSETAAERRESKPEMILYEAVRRMLPKNRLAKKMLRKLKIYAGPEHPHQAQQPIPIELGIKQKGRFRRFLPV